MTQNIYDRPDFFEQYRRIGRSVHGMDGALEWPALRAMLPPVHGRLVADLGCGFGWFCRWAREHGAVEVLGIDVSQNMLAQAWAATADPAIVYRRDDLETVELEAGRYDLVYSSLAFHYVVDMGRLFGVIFQSLAPGGWLVFSIEHPIYMAPSRPRWLEGGKTWPVDGYFREGPRVTDWLAPGVIKYHRTMGTTLGALLGAGFVLRGVEEWCPTAKQIAAAPELAEELERPIFLLVSAQKGG